MRLERCATPEKAFMKKERRNKHRKRKKLLPMVFPERSKLKDGVKVFEKRGEEYVRIY